MFTKQFAGLVTAVAALLSGGTMAHAASDPTGVWLNNTGRGAIEIKHCGKKLCGHVVWTKSKKDKKGCGKQIIGNVRKVGKRTWDYGWIYSPERGRKYSVELRPTKNDRLRVVGYAGSKFFSKTMYWKRAPEDLVRCDAPKAEPQIDAKATPKTEPKTAKVTPAKPPKIDADEKGAAKSDKDDSITEKADTETAAKTDTQPKTKRNRDDEDKDGDDVADAAADDEANDEDDDYASDEGDSGDFKVGELNLGDLKLDKMFKRTRSGRCKLNTPWIKLDFDCKK